MKAKILTYIKRLLPWWSCISRHLAQWIYDLLNLRRL